MRTLAELGEISKASFQMNIGNDRPRNPDDQQQRNRNIGNAAVGAGTVTAGGGLLAAGVPGAKPKVEAWHELRKPGGKKTRANWQNATSGGILGYREQAHKEYLKERQTGGAESVKHHPVASRMHEHVYEHGHEFPGRIATEEKVIPTIRRLKHAGHGVTALGLGAAGYGAHKLHQAKYQERKPVGKAAETWEEHRDKQESQRMGRGLGVGAVGLGVGAPLQYQATKYKREAGKQRKKAEKLVPEFKGMKSKEIMANAGSYAHHPKEVVHQAGSHMGSAAQSKYVSNVYGSHAKVLGGVGLAGLGAAALHHHKLKQNKEGR